MSQGGPIFGKPPQIKKISFSESVDQPTSNKSTPSNKKATSNEIRLKLVQHEIAEKEAQKFIKSICDELSKTYRIPYKEEDIVDLLSGILILGNVAKRMGNDKVESESTMKKVQAEALVQGRLTTDRVS